ncbi:T9SS C-terminal target domain-containing protein [Aquimarina sp. BL5]|uniref:glycosyl hydrolase family 8 n=1 Tax=Aquimarina sp. BL5 TaxID=1714860 RepID=UPI000E5279E6|nr:glycosyl hydrolase family 8 [Aquimarina sp. BL5]AXT52105.1 T9SS C-terminal target domain-containing protein [Aquimarina sp. BL5]RKM89796.1 carbohydrate-binding protein [Aquimarina sp. BL5]
MKTITTIFFKLFFLCVIIVSGQTTVQIEDLSIGGPYAGLIDSPFNGIAFYGNGDKAEGSISLPTVPGLYKVEITGASSNSSEAKINLNIGSNNLGAFSFSGASVSNSSREVTITGSNPLIFSLELITDNGSNDTFLDRISFTFLGSPPPPRPAPVIPSAPSFESGIYRNMFVESGKTETEVQQKMNAIWDHYFVNGDSTNERLYYEVGNDMAYILDTGNNDIRSEGMSYGMMICVQLGKKAEFDKLWRFAQKYSQHPIGTDREGLFSWQLNRTNFSMIDQNSAPDGEEYFVTALFFADALWGSSGSINYRDEADYILDSMLNKPAPSTSSCPTALVDQDEKQIVFGICGNSASFTDPSYHLPAFYEIWAKEAARNNQLWADMATISRTYLLPRAAHPETGLMPDYSEFDGRPVNQGNHGNFEFDAWRNIMNMGFDFAWFQKNKNDIQPLIDKQINFFKDKPGYSTLWTLDGSFSRNSDHSPGLVACNAVGALALEDSKVWPFVDEFFDTPIPSGQFRYYDGLLYMMSFMHLSGNFKAITDDVGIPDCNGTAFPIATVSTTDETTQGASDGKITFAFSDVSGREAIEFSNDGGATYPLNVNDNSETIAFNNLAPGTYNVWVRWGNNDCPTSLGNVVINEGDTVDPDPIQSPFRSHTIPGIIEAEDYDNGGQGIAYNDSDSSNNGSQGRTDEGVDLQNTTDNGGGTNVGWTANGEWLEYTIGDVTPGTYDIVLRVASTQNNSKSLALKLGTTELGSVAIPNTNGWQSWQNVLIENVQITSGNANQVLRLDVSGGLYNINWMRFEQSDSTTDSSNCDTIEAEDNTENFYQLNNVNGVVTNISYSHWMKFDNVDISGGKFTFRYAKGNNENGYMKVRIDNNRDSNNIAEIYPESTGGWNDYVEKTVNITGSGNHVVYLYFHNASRNIQLDWISFKSAGDQRIPEANELKEEETVLVFPNPSNGVVNIKVSEYNDIRRIVLFDVSGREIRSIKEVGQKEYSFSGLSKGVYLLKVDKNKKTIIRKLIVD